MLPSSLGFQRALPTTTTPTKLPGSTVLSRHFARDSIASTKTNSKTSRSSSKKTTTALSAVTASSVVTSLLSSPLGSISLLAGIVLIHEAGHYLAARSFGIEVEEFSVGVGPKLWGFTASNGNEFNLRALPLGGYVRFPENYNATLVQDLQQQAVEQAKQERDERKRKAAAAAAAAAARRGGIGTQFWNALSLGAVQQRQQKLKEEQEKQRAADAAAVSKPWWKFGANQKASNIEQGDDDDDDDEEELEVPPVEIPYDENPNLLQNRPWTERAVVLSGGVVRTCVVVVMTTKSQNT